MIVKDEEARLPVCLESVSDLVEEIIIVDTGSTDRTKEITRAYTEQVYDYAWQDDFSAARNYAFSLASQEFILWMDADDVITEANREKLKDLKQNLEPDVDSVIMNYVLQTDETSGEPLAMTRRNRLVRRCRGYRWVGIIHEYLDVAAGKRLLTDIAITHRGTSGPGHSRRNLHIIERWLAAGHELKGRLRFHLACELADAQRHEEAVGHFKDFLADGEALRDDLVMACSRLAECSRKLGRAEEELQALLRSLYYDVPRSEICCSLGKWFEERQQWRQAIYWYSQALQTSELSAWNAIVQTAARTWLPHSRLCLCYAQLGQLRQAYDHNKEALHYLPGDPGLQANHQKLGEALKALPE
ncbi:glycosyltransferase family 2 protein [Paenibacillus sanguinis]|uniref:glycosyltransferase family 2 protein n=1 Tax=Paenibacillus sanguinis TaxID=225906 RepID=UPI000381EA0A|nr:glycosyltransferase family 2 protein [Paenibacillus sanguinis]